MKCKKCGYIAVVPSIMLDHNCDAHNEDCPEYDDLTDPEGLYS